MNDIEQLRGQTPNAAHPPMAHRAGQTRSSPARGKRAAGTQAPGPAPLSRHRHHHWYRCCPSAFPKLRASRRMRALAAAVTAPLAEPTIAQGFEKVNTTVTNVNAILVTISVAVVTIAIIWAGFKMIFQGARLADVANVLIGGTLVGGAAAFAAFIVN